ncbi:DUF6477 family protein [Pseudooceanicola sp.]|uniref:DUF6477 family protein n=1 Tax=Pseudooceanicola sp. TaxID=1914328 RepID=UPI0026153D17|nr:DUF6477 family protein [Pseudooceanicola sp.]MDF1857133.1 DUF6477 family protein [Pseudooceanicola sp.]
MQDILTRLATLRRPNVLITAARIGADHYRRDRHLRRFFGLARLPRSGEALQQLMEIEAQHNDNRRADDAAYAVTAHVEVMIAILGEARLLALSRQPGADAGRAEA